MPRVPFFDVPGNRLRALVLFSLGLTQADVARELGLSSQTVSRWLSKDAAARRHFAATRLQQMVSR